MGARGGGGPGRAEDMSGGIRNAEWTSEGRSRKARMLGRENQLAHIRARHRGGESGTGSVRARESILRRSLSRCLKQQEPDLAAAG
eukprot:5448789-Pyramimonas_sp.AAC.3